MPCHDERARDQVLKVFLRGQTQRAMVYGVSDCLLTPADWCVALGLPDPAAAWRGTYEDEDGADAVLTRHGGTILLMRDALASIGIGLLSHGVRRAAPGDIAAVTVLGPRGPAVVGAIRTERRWAVRAGRGMWFGRAEPLAVWRPEV